MIGFVLNVRISSTIMRFLNGSSSLILLLGPGLFFGSIISGLDVGIFVD